MKKRIFTLLSIFLLALSFINAQWTGTDNLTITINQLPNKTIDTSMVVVGNMTINGQPLDVSCAVSNIVEFKAVDTGSALSLTICGTTKTYQYFPDKAVISNGNNFSFTFSKVEQAPTKFDFPIDSTKLNVYYDAIVLEKGSPAQKEIIFKKYNLTKTSTPHMFLVSFHSEIQSSDVQSADTKTKTPTFNLSAATGINVTKLADGLAKFISSQFKKELTISFFNRLTEKLQDPDTRDLQVLFENTFGQLELIGDKFTHYEAYLASLRQSMELDCYQLPQQFEKLLDDPTSQLSNALDSIPNVQYILDNVLKFGLELKDSVHIGRAFADLDFSKNVGLAPVDQNLKGSLETIQLLSESLRNINNGPDDSYWISETQMEHLVEDTTLLNIYFGLLAEKSKIDGIRLASDSLYNIFTDSKVTKIRELLDSVIETIKYIEDIIQSAKKGMNNENKDIVAMQYYNAATELISSSNHMAPLMSKPEAQKLKHFDNIASDVNDMTQSFVTQKYSVGLLYLSKVLTGIDSTSKTIKKINGVLGNQGLFFAQMAESETSDDVAAILENFAAPTGSWRDKRTAQWNIALDSYIGPAYYYVKKNDTRLAFSTPVGASVTIPYNNFTFFLSALDLGPLTSFRLTNDTSQIAKVYLKEILSPGAFVSINFGDNYPVTLNVGYQQFPLLNKVGTTENAVNVTREGGFSGSIVVNIPLFTMYNDPKD